MAHSFSLKSAALIAGLGAALPAYGQENTGQNNTDDGLVLLCSPEPVSLWGERLSEFNLQERLDEGFILQDDGSYLSADQSTRISIREREYLGDTEDWTVYTSYLYEPFPRCIEDTPTNVRQAFANIEQAGVSSVFEQTTAAYRIQSDESENGLTGMGINFQVTFTINESASTAAITAGLLVFMADYWYHKWGTRAVDMFNNPDYMDYMPCFEYGAFGARDDAVIEAAAFVVSGILSGQLEEAEYMGLNTWERYDFNGRAIKEFMNETLDEFRDRATPASIREIRDSLNTKVFGTNPQGMPLTGYNESGCPHEHGPDAIITEGFTQPPRP
jgi:hypothetical protein